MGEFHSFQFSLLSQLLDVHPHPAPVHLLTGPLPLPCLLFGCTSEWSPDLSFITCVCPSFYVLFSGSLALAWRPRFPTPLLSCLPICTVRWAWARTGGAIPDHSPFHLLKTLLWSPCHQIILQLQPAAVLYFRSLLLISLIFLAPGSLPFSA